MAYLIDTTILARLANATDPQHFVAARAVLELHRSGEVLHLTPQVLIEFRNVATRPVIANGLNPKKCDDHWLHADCRNIRLPKDLRPTSSVRQRSGCA